MFEAALNGFGRFGFGLFRAWFQDENSNYRIRYINDHALSGFDIKNILLTDTSITDFHKCDIHVDESLLRITAQDGRTQEIEITKGTLADANWLGLPDVVFECSGVATNHENCANMVMGSTRNVIVGATISQSDATLIMGHNHEGYDPTKHKIISFGSCTVIPGVHVISLIMENFDCLSVTVNIVHSVPKWQLEQGRWKSLFRKKCSLETVAPQVIDMLDANTLKVNYTYAPYQGVSLMDFEFVVNKHTNVNDIQTILENATRNKSHSNFLATSKTDNGGEEWDNAAVSIGLILDSVDVRDGRIYFYGYFNNEGSGIRLHELCKFILEKNESINSL